MRRRVEDDVAPVERSASDGEEELGRPAVGVDVGGAVGSGAEVGEDGAGADEDELNVGDVLVGGGKEGEAAAGGRLGGGGAHGGGGGVGGRRRMIRRGRELSRTSHVGPGSGSGVRCAATTERRRTALRCEPVPRARNEHDQRSKADDD